MQSSVTLQKVTYIYTNGLKWVSEHLCANSATKNSLLCLRAPDPQTLPSAHRYSVYALTTHPFYFNFPTTPSSFLSGFPTTTLYAFLAAAIDAIFTSFIFLVIMHNCVVP